MKWFILIIVADYKPWTSWNHNLLSQKQYRFFRSEFHHLQTGVKKQLNDIWQNSRMISGNSECIITSFTTLVILSTPSRKDQHVIQGLDFWAQWCQPDPPTSAEERRGEDWVSSCGMRFHELGRCHEKLMNILDIWSLGELPGQWTHKWYCRLAGPVSTGREHGSSMCRTLPRLSLGISFYLFFGLSWFISFVMKLSSYVEHFPSLVCHSSKLSDLRESRNPWICRQWSKVGMACELHQLQGHLQLVSGALITSLRTVLSTCRVCHDSG